MRSPLLAFTVLAIGSVSPALAAPAKSPRLGELNGLSTATTHVIPRQVPGLPGTPGLPDTSAVTGILDPAPAQSDDNSDEDKHSDHHGKDKHQHGKRAYDFGTAGGNAYTGATSNASGGSIINAGGSEEGVMNAGGNEAGDSGDSESGDAAGGSGFNHGPGGNAYTGASGKTHGGDVINSGGGIDNTVDMTSLTAANQAGDGDGSYSGDAAGGDANDDHNTVDDCVRKRSLGGRGC